MYKYPIEDYNKDHMARGVGVGLPISRKDSIEICNFIRGRKVTLVKNDLKEVSIIKKAIPMRRFNGDRGHKKGIGPGKYPVKAALEILGLLESVEANAQFKGLNTADLIVYHASASKGATQWHYGRQKRRLMKRANIVLVVKEEKSKKENKPKKDAIKKDKGDSPKKDVSDKVIPKEAKK